MGLLDVFRRNKGTAAAGPSSAEKGWAGGTGYGYDLPISGGMIPTDWPWNFWQQGRDPIRMGNNPTVAACVDAYAHTMAALKTNHVRYDADGGKTIITTSPAARFLRAPNSYQTRTDFMMNFIKALLYNGNAYAAAIRDQRGQITQVNQLDSIGTHPMVEPDTHQIFYAAGGNDLTDYDPSVLIPQRDVLHVRLYTPRHPLVGVSPITNLTMNIMSNNAITAHQATFYNNMSRPSGIISVDKELNREQMQTLREAWHAQSRQLNSGGVPILAFGAKWNSMVLSSQDSQMVEAFQMGVEEIARAFRVPPPLIGDTGDSTYNNVEQLVSNWLAMGLGFHVEHMETALSRFFGLPPDQSIEFDVDSLMRTDFAGRIDALTKGITGGLYSPNEARRKEGLPEVDFGDEPRLQAQVVPLSQVGLIPAADTAPAADGVAITDDEDDDDEAEQAAVQDATAAFDRITQFKTRAALIEYEDADG